MGGLAGSAASALAFLLLLLLLICQTALADIPPCELHPNCKTEEICTQFDGPNTENELVFDNICLNNVQWAEPRNSGVYDKLWDAGVYKCSCCGQDLYSSEHKYNSYSGWPAFYDTITPDAVLLNPDDGELVCSRCGAHLGHRFSDGPEALTGLRDCINSACMHFEADSSMAASDPDLTLEPLTGSTTGGSAGEIDLDNLDASSASAHWTSNYGPLSLAATAVFISVLVLCSIA